MHWIVLYIAGFMFAVIGSSMWSGELPFVAGLLVGLGIVLAYNAGRLQEINRS